MTQGDPVPPIVFNIVLDAVVRAVLDVFFGTQESQNDMGWAAGEINLVFYTNDGRIDGRDHEWVQDALKVTVAMFLRMGLNANLNSTKAMVCTLRCIWGDWGGDVI